MRRIEVQFRDNWVIKRLHANIEVGNIASRGENKLSENRIIERDGEIAKGRRNLRAFSTKRENTG